MATAESLEIRTLLSATASATDTPAAVIEIHEPSFDAGEMLADDVAQAISDRLLASYDFRTLLADTASTGVQIVGELQSQSLGSGGDHLFHFRLTANRSTQLDSSANRDTASGHSDVPSASNTLSVVWHATAIVPVSSNNGESLVEVTLQLEPRLQRLPQISAVNTSSSELPDGADQPLLQLTPPVSIRDSATIDGGVVDSGTAQQLQQEIAASRDDPRVSQAWRVAGNLESQPVLGTLLINGLQDQSYAAGALPFSKTLVMPAERDHFRETLSHHLTATDVPTADTARGATVVEHTAGMPSFTGTMPVVAFQQAALSLAGVLEDVLLTFSSLLHAVGIEITSSDSGGSAPTARTVAPVFPGGTDHRQIAGSLDPVCTIILKEQSSTSFVLNVLRPQRQSIESLTIDRLPRHGVLTVDDPVAGRLRFAPDPGFAGADSAVWRVQFDDGSQSTGTVVFLVDRSRPQQLINDAFAPGRSLLSQTSNGQSFDIEDHAVRDAAFSSDEVMRGLTD